MGSDARALLEQMKGRLERGPHAALGVAEGATPQVARSAFLQLTKTYHPVKFAREAPEIVRQANEVFLALRAAYEAITQPGSGPRKNPTRATPAGGVPITPPRTTASTPQLGPASAAAAAPARSNPPTPPREPATAAAAAPPRSNPPTPPREQAGAARGTTGRLPRDLAAAPATPPAQNAANPTTTPIVTIKGGATPPRGAPAAGSGSTATSASARPTPSSRIPVAPATPAPAPTASRPAARAPAAPAAGPVRATPVAGVPVAPAATPTPAPPPPTRPSTGAIPQLSPGVVPGSEEADLEIAMYHLRKKQWTEARKVLHGLAARLRTEKKYRALLAYARGREAQDDGRHDDARAEFARALQDDPELAAAKAALAQVSEDRSSDRPSSGGLLSRLFKK